MSKNALIVLANPEPKSLNHTLAEIAREELSAQGYTVVISDLYQQNFDPRLGPHDVTKRANPDFFQPFAEQAHAAEHGTFAPDIQAEIDKVQAADLILFQFPMWWWGMPAILKGWCDRVLAYKIAYGLGQWWDTGMLKGKRAMASITTGSPKSSYAPDGRNGDGDRLLWMVEAGIFAICGCDVLKSHVIYGSMWVDETTRAGMIDGFRQRIKGIEQDQPMFFHKLDEYQDDMRLKPEVAPKTIMQWRPQD